MNFSLYHYSPDEYTAYDPSSRAVAHWVVSVLRTHLRSSSDRNFNAIVPVKSILAELDIHLWSNTKAREAS